jgi:toxin ParE1/3/4
VAHRLAPEAAADLDAIWYYMARESGEAEIADHLVESIAARFALLVSFPQLGRRRDDLRPGLRSFPVGEYLILYRIEEADVLVLHVTHGHRDSEALFRQ